MDRSSFVPQLLAAAALAVLAGCASRPTTPAESPAPPASAAAPAPEPEPAREAPAALPRSETVATSPTAPPAAPAVSPAVPPAAPPATLTGQAALLVASEPSGGTVVLDGRPVGHTPVTITLPVTARGYLSRQVSLKVRFVAGNGTDASHSTELVLTPLDRAPVRLDFTPAGARRTLATLD